MPKVKKSINNRFQFSKYSGAEMTVFAKMSRREIAENGQIKTVKDANYMKLGDLFSIKGVIRTQYVPRYAVGNADPIALSKGKRLITGSLIFTVFDGSVIEKLAKHYIESFENVSKNSAIRTANAFGIDEIGTVNEENNAIENNSELNKIYYGDQIPPFDVVIGAAKEDNVNVKSKKILKGVKLFKNQSAVGLNSILTQEQYQFMAKDVVPLKREKTVTTDAGS